VIRVAASYVVIAWLLLQIADVAFGPLGVPNWVMVALIVAAVPAFPVAIVLAWFIEIGARGVEFDTAGVGEARPVATRWYRTAVPLRAGTPSPFRCRGSRRRSSHSLGTDGLGLKNGDYGLRQGPFRGLAAFVTRRSHRAISPPGARSGTWTSRAR